MQEDLTQKTGRFRRPAALLNFISAEIMSCDENIIVLIDFSVIIDIRASLFIDSKLARIEIMAFKKNVIVLIYRAVLVDISVLIDNLRRLACADKKLGAEHEIMYFGYK